MGYMYFGLGPVLAFQRCASYCSTSLIGLPRFARFTARHPLTIAALRSLARGLVPDTVLMHIISVTGMIFCWMGLRELHIHGASATKACCSQRALHVVALCGLNHHRVAFGGSSWYGTVDLGDGVFDRTTPAQNLLCYSGWPCFPHKVLAFLSA